MRKRALFVMVVVLGLVLGLSALGSMQVHQVRAGPLAAPTPIAAPAGGEDWLMVTYLDYDGVTYGQAGNTIHDPSYTVADIQHDLDIASAQAVTCTLQFSDNSTTWDNGLNVIANKSADETDMNQYNLFGQYSRITCTLETSAAVTITVVGKLHRQ